MQVTNCRRPRHHLLLGEDDMVADALRVAEAGQEQDPTS